MVAASRLSIPLYALFLPGPALSQTHSFMLNVGYQALLPFVYS